LISSLLVRGYTTNEGSDNLKRGRAEKWRKRRKRRKPGKQIEYIINIPLEGHTSSIKFWVEPFHVIG